MKRIKEQPKICEWCQKPFARNRYNGRLESLVDFQKRKFCCKACSKFKPLEEITDRAKYLRARKKLKDKCQGEGCNENDKKKLHQHHIDHDINNWDDDNLETLCKECHEKLHGRPIFRPYEVEDVEEAEEEIEEGIPS